MPARQPNAEGGGQRSSGGARLLTIVHRPSVLPSMPKSAPPSSTASSARSRKARATPETGCCPTHVAEPALFDGLSDLSRRAHGVLQASPGALSAYDLIDRLQPQVAQRIYPQTIYRALAALGQHGLVHRIASTNTYRACSQPGHPHDSIHFLCRTCGSVEEAVDDAIGALLEAHAKAHRFVSDSRVVELSGICVHCSGAPSATGPGRRG